MRAAERRDLIEAEVRQYGFVRAAELASRLNVSRVTVWRDIEHLVSAGRLARFHGGAAVPGDAPPTAGLTIGMQVPDVRTYFSDVIDGVRQVCDSVGARLLVASSGSEDPREAEGIMRGMLDNGADGLLIAPTEKPYHLGGPEWSRFDWVDKPMVVVERDMAGISTQPREQVASSHEAGIHAAVTHLAQRGHERIALTSVHYENRLRLRLETAYSHAMQDILQKGPDEHAVWRTNAAEARSLISRIRDERVTATIVVGDRLCAAIALHATGAGLKVPEDLALVAHGDEVAAQASPPLTAISQRRTDIGVIAAERLINHLRDVSQLAGTRTFVEPVLVVREST